MSPRKGKGQSGPKGQVSEAGDSAAAERDSQQSLSQSERPVRGRGGFRQPELRTIPANVTALRSQNLPGVRQVSIVANFVQLAPMPKKETSMYRVDFKPNVEAEERRKILYKLAARQLFTTMDPVFDGGFECRSGLKLKQKVTHVDKLVDPRDETKTEHIVTFTHTGTVGFGFEGLRLYNMQMKTFLRKLGFYQPQPGLYVHPNHSTPIGNEIMMSRGFRTSANVHEDNKVLMNLEGAHKLVQKNNVLQHMEKIRISLGGKGGLRQALETELTGKVVVTSYNKRVYRIEQVDFNTRPTATFDRNGVATSYIDYYRTVYNLTIKDAQQPLLKCVPNNQRRRDEAGREVFIVPEFCNIAGLTDQQRADTRLKIDLIRESQVPPGDRVRHMREFMSAFHSNDSIKQQLVHWGYSFGVEPVELKAYVLPATKVDCGDSRVTESDQKTAAINVNSLAVAPQIKKIVIITPRLDPQSKKIINENLLGGFRHVGLKHTPPIYVDMQGGDRPADYIRDIRNVAPDADIAIVIMKYQNKGSYDAIKKVASVEKGLTTQVVTAKLMTDPRKARSAAAKIGIQIAAKVGGEPWRADIPLKKTMVCGYDTYHDTAQRGRSFGAFLASLNQHCSRWWSKADAHDRMDEMSAQVSANITEAVKHYRKFNSNQFPERVIMYRDGVGEGQLEHVYSVELKRVQEALDKLGGPAKIKLTMIVVNKRIGARFYMRMGNGFANPPPGTVIDHTVTRQARYDFFLVSQSTARGTVTPTYYNIIYDESGFTPDFHQKVAFKFCLMYYNWSGTVRVPAPCQYAHKLAFLCGEHLHAQPNANLDEKLHFL